MKLFGNQIRWSDPEHEAWKRKQDTKYGWGGTDSVWTVKFILLVCFLLLPVIYLVVLGLTIDLRLIRGL